MTATVLEATHEVKEIWTTRCPVPTASGLAQHFRWIHQPFEAEGISVNSLRDSLDPAVRRSHSAHGLPASFREGGNIPAIWAKACGQDTVVVGITSDDVEIIDIPGYDFEQRNPDDSHPTLRHVTVDALPDGRVDVIYAQGAHSASLVCELVAAEVLELN